MKGDNWLSEVVLRFPHVLCVIWTKRLIKIVGEVIERVKYWLCKHEDLRADAWSGMFVIPTVVDGVGIEGKKKRQSKMGPSVWFAVQVQWESLSQKPSWRNNWRKTFPCQPLLFTWYPVSKGTHTHIDLLKVGSSVIYLRSRLACLKTKSKSGSSWLRI